MKFLLVIILIFLFVYFFLGRILKALLKAYILRKMKAATGGTETRDTSSKEDLTPKDTEKVFSETEGEYVNYEEIKEE